MREDNELQNRRNTFFDTTNEGDMRIIACTGCLLLLGMALIAEGRLNDTCELTLELVDADTGRPLPGLVRITDGNGARLPISELLPRDLSPGVEQRIDHWSVLVEKTILKVPRQKLVVEAFFGLETELARVPLDLSAAEKHDMRIPLRTFYHAASKGFRSANTHLHLMKLTRELSDRYLMEVPKADGLDVLFVSYLERADAQKDYITNRYTQADLDALSQKSGVRLGNGEEHRHNFTAQGQGFGHVMLLDIKQLILPVSIGQGIMKTGTDGLPVQRGIDQARRDGATVIWCHNNWGLEDIPNLVTGRLHALNIFDGNKLSSYKHSFYRYLNAGVRIPFSTGTDWFMYDFARVYVPADQPVTPREWLNGLVAGKSYITNGPFLELRVAGRSLGDTVSLSEPGMVEVLARATGRADFEKIELVQNGNIIRTQASRPEGGHFVAEMRIPLPIDTPCWLALRLPPQPVKDDPEFSTPVPPNELGQPLFAHTSPVYVEVAGRAVFDRTVAAALLAEMEQSIKTIEKEAQFADGTEKARVLDVYAEGIDVLKKRLEAR